MQSLKLLALLAVLVPMAEAYCNLKTYHSYLKKQEITCGSSKSTYCDKECKKSITSWVMYSDGCVAPNENSLPHPFLDDNGINPVYQKDMHEMKVRYKHYCGKPWSAGAQLSPLSKFVSLVVGAAVVVFSYRM
ncbi:hypothetical protein GUITHDRAFT_103473 [Guillardia theta CCMP2712]|uniref:Uncharacterized protein n=1 Tax=Guillardia theta (strain CCMP2712) TaxID=905079 RepID=L1JRH8_GUITC|nr:hypothetical protein GUITHDRAFT_103473 [Guillardia theta CCMP2712]EKX50889.1 hypothetical protein GUITHDRAFT_103473 [Guillardia theta CCMP2712]|eukprot:XP_005837869.1 hypothetical protein GUITHDRAFT_103473 [Guillardia theta CCMP2712]